MSNPLPEYTQDEINQLLAMCIVNTCASKLDDDSYDTLEHISSGMYNIKEDE